MNPNILNSVLKKECTKFVLSKGLCYISFKENGTEFTLIKPFKILAQEVLTYINSFGLEIIFKKGKNFAFVCMDDYEFRLMSGNGYEIHNIEQEIKEIIQKEYIPVSPIGWGNTKEEAILKCLEFVKGK